jgi:mRNA interferase MazF
MVMRGGVYWIGLDKRRPCVVVSSAEVLSVDVWQTHVVPITSNVGRAGIASNVLLSAASSGLPKDSVAVPLGLELIDRSLLGQQTGRLPAVLMGDIDDGLRAVLGLQRS